MIRKVHISRLAVPGGTGLLSGSLPLRRFSSRLSRSFMAFRPAGVAAIYSHRTEMEGVPVASLFDCTDLPDYASYPPDQCPFCRQGKPLDAVVNSFGYSTVSEE